MKHNLPIRALALGAFLSVLVTLYSAYAGLKVGGVYWPILTTTLASMAILKYLGGKHDRNEINIAQTAGSAGGLLAAGVIFTIPAFYMMGMDVPLWQIFLVSICGGLLGVVFSYPLRGEMLDNDKLPYPDGTAAADMIKTGDEGGAKIKLLGAGFGIGALVAVLRDFFGAIPGAVSFTFGSGAARRYASIGSAVSLIPFAGGYLIGIIFTSAWAAGAVVTNFMIAPVMVNSGQYIDKAEVVGAMAKPLGIGIVIGSALAYMVLVGLPRFRKVFSKQKEKREIGTAGIFSKERQKYAGAILVIVALLAVAFNLDIGIMVLALAGAFLLAYLGARVTGEMNVDPMEIFAIIVLIAAKVLFGATAGPLVLLAAVVTIAAGVAGDMMQDLKTGKILGTPPEMQLIAQVIGVVAGALVIGLVITAIGGKTGFGGADFPAPQAVAIKEIVSNSTAHPVCLQGTSGGKLAYLLSLIGMSDCLGLGAVLGVLLTIASQFAGSAALPIAFGIGMYVPIELSVPMFIGGCIRAVVDKLGKTEMVRVAAAGAIAGEGLIGAIIAIAGAFFLFFK